MEAALAAGAAVGEFHTYPGAALLGVLREKPGQGDAVGFANLAQRIAGATASRSYKEDACDWDLGDDDADVPPDRLPATLGAHDQPVPQGAPPRRPVHL